MTGEFTIRRCGWFPGASGIEVARVPLAAVS